MATADVRVTGRHRATKAHRGLDVHGDQVATRHLLYTFADDQAGQVTGQGVQGFFVATPGLAPIAGSPTSAGSSASAGTVPAASSGSGYGY